MAAKNGRNANGTYAPGNQGGPGRPKRGPERSYLDATAEIVTVDEWKEVVRKALTDAKLGNARARQWLTDVLLGPNVLLDQQLLDAYYDLEAKVAEQNRLKEELLQLQRAERAVTYDPTQPDPIDRFCVQEDTPAAVPADDVDLLADTAFAFGEPAKPAGSVVYNYGGRLVAADDNDDDVGRILRG
jgi:hypothetical protein